MRRQVLVACVAALVLLPHPAAADTGTAPAFQRTLGGPLHAEMSPSGVEIGPSGEVVVADTGGNRVKKYGPGGALLWATGRHGSGTGQFSNPRDVGIDSAGNIYVADPRNSRIVKLSASGNWITSFAGPAGDRISFPMGVSVSNNLVYVAHLGRSPVRVFDTAGNQIRALTSQGACTISAPRDADADAQGNIYVANYGHNNILKFSPTGACLTSWGGTGSADGQFRTPYGVRLAFDPVLNQQLVYVADANNNRVQMFRRDGGFVGKAGTTGPLPPGPGQFFQLRRAAVAANGDVWGADLWGLRVARFARTSTGWTFAQTIGGPLPPPTAGAVFHEPHQVAFDTSGNLIVADTVHHRLVRMTPQGAILGTCGRRGWETGNYNWPRGVAVDAATGQIWVANTKQYNIHVLQANCAPIARFGAMGAGNDQFNWPYAIAIRQTDRIAFVADTMNHRIKAYDVATRRFISSFGTKGSGTGQFFEPSGVATSPVTGRVWVADARNNRLVELADKGGWGMSVVRTITAGLQGPQSVAVDGAGRLYVADSGNNRVVVLGANGAVLAEFTSPNGFDRPESVAVDPAGRLYVSDTYRDRIQAYAPFGGTGSPPPPPPSSPPPDSADTTPPSATVSNPTGGQVFPAGSIRFAGAATDNVGVASVRVAIRNTTTGAWWRANGTWGAYQAHDATLSAPGAPSTNWSHTWPAPGPGSYGLLVETRDTAGNPQPAPKPWVTFRVGG